MKNKPDVNYLIGTFFSVSHVILPPVEVSSGFPFQEAMPSSFTTRST